MDLIRELLDKQIIDRNHRKIGKVDGVVVELRASKPPRIAAVELGVSTLARRLSPTPRRVLEFLTGHTPRQNKPHRVDWNKVRDIGVDIKLDIDVRDTKIMAWQDWLRDHIIGRIPGA